MPEAKFAYSFTPEPPKKPPIAKMSCGIGDTDCFPAFDVESDAYATKDDSKWGFLITGGAEFHMPLTVFQVTPEGLADKGGIRLGDIILEINEEDATHLTLTQAHQIIDAAPKKIHFLVKSMDDEEQMDGYEPGEEKSIVLRVPKPMPPPKASIEQRLREMQRKLSEIAEIPRILSSTLATVSQTFDKLMPADPAEVRRLMRRGSGGRKLSYDEDALDYELSDNGNDDDDDDNDREDDNGDDNDSDDGDRVDDGQRKKEKEEIRRKRPKAKEITPESDYASEANYLGREDGDETDEDDDDFDYEDHGDDDDDDDVDEHPVEGEEDSDGDDDEEDFLSTSYTWNLRNVPKLRLNDDDNEAEAMEDEPENLKRSSEVESEAKQEKQEKLEKFERSWPWADREKIIYKQSTCHLVPRKPLGLVEKRIQLLAKQHLLDNLGQMEKK